MKWPPGLETYCDGVGWRKQGSHKRQFWKLVIILVRVPQWSRTNMMFAYRETDRQRQGEGETQREVFIGNSYNCGSWQTPGSEVSKLETKKAGGGSLKVGRLEMKEDISFNSSLKTEKGVTQFEGHRAERILSYSGRVRLFVLFLPSIDWMIPILGRPIPYLFCQFNC